MSFTAKDVKELREKTGCGMMDCKKALSASDGDMEKAIDFLREKGLILDTFGTYQFNYGRYDMVEISFEKLKELNPKDFKENFRSRSHDLELF